MDWLKARSLRRLGSIRATLRVAVDDAPAAADVLGLAEAELAAGLELELQAAAASARAVPRTSITGRRSGWVFMAVTSIGEGVKELVSNEWLRE